MRLLHYRPARAIDAASDWARVRARDVWPVPLPVRETLDVVHYHLKNSSSVHLPNMSISYKCPSDRKRIMVRPIVMPIRRQAGSTSAPREVSGSMASSGALHRSPSIKLALPKPRPVDKLPRGEGAPQQSSRRLRKLPASKGGNGPTSFRASPRSQRGKGVGANDGRRSARASHDTLTATEVAAKEVAATEVAETEVAAKEEAATEVAATECVIADELLELSKLDDHLVEALRRGVIRLVRCSWFVALPSDYRLERMQELEERERAGQSPLLTPAEAVEHVRRADRRIGVLSHGWLSPHHCDPLAVRTPVVQQALMENDHLVGLFWECVRPSTALLHPFHSSLSPRTEDYYGRLASRPQLPLPPAEATDGQGRGSLLACIGPDGRLVRQRRRHVCPAVQGDPCTPRRARRRALPALAVRRRRRGAGGADPRPLWPDCARRAWRPSARGLLDGARPLCLARGRCRHRRRWRLRDGRPLRVRLRALHRPHL